MPKPIQHSYDFVMIFDVVNGNPNGDPNMDGMPRMDAVSGKGLVSGVSTKRKIRDIVLDMRQHGEVEDTDEHAFDIHVVAETSLDTCQIDALNSLGATSTKKINGLKKSDPEFEKKLTDYIYSHYWDIRTFGGVMTHLAKAKLNSQLHGPVQIEIGQSIDPIFPEEMCITRKGASNEDVLDEKGQVAMGRNYYVPYGLYVQKGHIDASSAEKSGFDEDDLNLLWDAIQLAFMNTHSAMLGEVDLKELIVFEHPGRLRRCKASKLAKLIKIKKKEDVEVPMSFDDYRPIEIDESNIPCGIKMTRMVED